MFPPNDKNCLSLKSYTNEQYESFSNYISFCPWDKCHREKSSYSVIVGLMLFFKYYVQNKIKERKQGQLSKTKWNVVWFAKEGY